MGTCGIAAGARETMQAILDELARREINAHVTTVGCIGMCSSEPLVDIQQGDEPRVTYGEITADKVPRLIEEHVVNNRVVEEWVVARVGGRGGLAWPNTEPTFWLAASMVATPIWSRRCKRRSSVVG